MTTFDSMGLPQPLLNGISQMGFTEPTPVQEKVIPTLLSNPVDLVALAPTGTGKTAAFGLPLLSYITEEKYVQAVVLCPTRELCIQITKDFNNFSQELGKINITAIYGGAGMQGQIRDIKRGTQIIVATPGRLLDLIERRVVDLREMNYLVFDEADEMLNMGFKDSIDAILQNTPPNKTTWLFSATMPPEVRHIAGNYMNDPVEMTLGGKNQTNKNILHQHCVVKSADRYLALKRVLDFAPEVYAIVFCRTKIETQKVADLLIQDGYNADALHGDLSQQQRNLVMQRYRNKSVQILVATDVAARGIDVDDVTHVIHYQLPDEAESYTHRSGRTARAGKKGISISIITQRDFKKLQQIEKIIKQKSERISVPSGQSVFKNQLKHFVDRVQETEVNPEINEYIKDLELSENEESRELMLKFLSIEFEKFLKYYKNADDINDAADKGGKSGTSLFLGLGQKDKLDNKSIRQFIQDTANIPSSAIYRVESKSIFSFIDVDPKVEDKILKAFKNVFYEHRKVKIEVRTGDDGRSGRKGFRNKKRMDKTRHRKGGSGSGPRKAKRKARF